MRAEQLDFMGNPQEDLQISIKKVEQFEQKVDEKKKQISDLDA